MINRRSQCPTSGEESNRRQTQGELSLNTISHEKCIKSPTGFKWFIRSLIHCKDLLTWESTWEQFQIIQEQFLTFHLEDKVALTGGYY